MNGPTTLVKCAAVGLFAGLFIGAGPELGNDFVAIAGLMALIVAVMAAFRADESTDRGERPRRAD